MKPVKIHRPGIPIVEEPPEQLVALADIVHDPLVIQSGITTTPDGRWALYLTVPANTKVPIASIERGARGFPVVYEPEPQTPPIAGPAYPG